MNELDKIFSQSKHANTFATGYLNYLNQVLSGFNVEEISAFVRILVDARERDAQIFFMGNGGSATTASHPYKPYQFNSQWEVDSYNSDVERYNMDVSQYVNCIREYADNGKNDMERIREAINDAINDANTL